MLCFTCVLFASIILISEGKECSSPKDCAPGECCVLGMERYAIPQCEALGKVSSFCREDAEPDDRTLFYPNFIFRYIEDMYTLFCPCEEPLVCRKNRCSKG
ncbi:uncharacterized protein NPIL_198262 [Nephila pilipes]|uniref:Venom protein n=1 Tax=Nephila pilipes TaxID=299642 RepID=A0A8X6PQ51_NEPPI|nr:uncharacterized protein NPIL_198262 [Nephila pilipes]